MIERDIRKEGPVRLEGTLATEQKANPNPQVRNNCSRDEQDVDESIFKSAGQELAYIQWLRTKGCLGVDREIWMVEIGERRERDAFARSRRESHGAGAREYSNG